MKTIAVANRKGGVGKSSVATHLAAALGIQGWRVLVIDMDSQASTTSMLLDEVPDDALTTTQLLLGEARLPDLIRPSTRDGVSIAPSSSDLTQAQFAIAGRTGRETILRRAMREVEGFDIAVIDTAPELQPTSMLLDEVPDDALTTTQLLLGEARLPDLICPSTRDGVSIAPSSSDLTQAQFAIAGRTGRETILRRAMREVEGFDIAVIDTAPELQLATLNTLVAASHVLLPFTPDPKALEGLETTCDAVAEIAAAELARPAILGCVQVAYDRRLAVTEQSRRQVQAAYGPLLFDTCIRANSSFIVCPAWHRDIFAMEKQERGKSRGSRDYLALAGEVTERLSLGAARAAHESSQAAA